MVYYSGVATRVNVRQRASPHSKKNVKNWEKEGGNREKEGKNQVKRGKIGRQKLGRVFYSAPPDR